jgi:predicted small metal-binding protein
MEKEISCDCGWRARGTEDELVAAAQQHGQDVHDMIPTREQVLATARPFETQPAGTQPAGTPPAGTPPAETQE